MRCPDCNSEDINHSGTKYQGKWYKYSCNYCGYVWMLEEVDEE